MRSSFTGALAFAGALAFMPSVALAQVSVDSGETFTFDDLVNGTFLGMPFTLSEDLTIDVNDGGVIPTRSWTATSSSISRAPRST